MLAALRRAWKRYLASIPRAAEEPRPLSDAAILREMQPRLSQEMQHVERAAHVMQLCAKLDVRFDQSA